MLINNASFNYYDLCGTFEEESLINFTNNFVSNGISIDSRSIAPGNIFVALRGSNLDGHDKIIEAIGKGASAVMGEQSWLDSNINGITIPVISTSDNLKALGKLAHFHRIRYNIPVIAVGGSNGKTTTKEMIAHLLSQKHRVLRTHENFNNQLGVPLMMLQLTDEYDVAVIEIATNEPGEIYILSEILAPTHGILTNIGEEHLEKLFDLDGVEMEETYLFGYLRKHDGTAFINMDDPRLSRYINILEKFVTFGEDPDSVLRAKVSFTETLNPIISFYLEDKNLDVTMKTTGYTTALNAIAATAVALNLGLSGTEIQEGLASFETRESHGYGRMVLEELGGIRLINDCYNANPSSMKMALRTLREYPAPRKIAVLGDMYELGDTTAEGHRSMLALASESADMVFITGELMNQANTELSGLKNITYFENKILLAGHLKSIISNGDIILVKGSRGMRMENIIQELKS
jgi:UDP-N-acetylmuramoyl-tripeptide--D-alanyl-D-alanine ligase